MCWREKEAGDKEGNDANFRCLARHPLLLHPESRFVTFTFHTLLCQQVATDLKNRRPNLIFKWQSSSNIFLQSQILTKLSREVDEEIPCIDPLPLICGIQSFRAKPWTLLSVLDSLNQECVSWSWISSFPISFHYPVSQTAGKESDRITGWLFMTSGHKRGEREKVS